ncbi:universal stress protein [Modestobacter sp. VKM Ac-2979]|uniref:universal stress protein n=1 Tax=unclassified Modestobacter TaxID=2643866 RepID=UPI0022AB9A35|nr:MULTISPECIES: universal stress protein [unclassified Modestobacter]MCZ2812069.1 universal stress protein [Modestobacter sp. VKM Ac-2979]MCZ2843793.1 universal stress protein [Modestobacter sp. VKM Ac-2980]
MLPGPDLSAAPPRRRPWLVVGVGGTQESRGALLWALHEAARRDGTVLAVTVWNGGSETERAEREAELVARVREAVEETGVRGRTQVQLVAGPVAEVLTALSEEADVLVLGQHHLTG